MSTSKNNGISLLKIKKVVQIIELPFFNTI